MTRVLRMGVATMVGLFLVLGAALPAAAERPKVVKATPDNGAKNVDPATRELRIVFDQAMDTVGGYSVVGGGPEYPKTIGRPRWEGDRTFIMSIRLEPNHKYWLSINSGTFQGFRSKTGEAAEPYPIAFETGAGKAAAEKLTPEDNRKAIEQLQEAIEKHYSYRDLRKVDWAAAFKEATPKLQAAQTAKQFADEAAKLLAKAQDAHVWLEVDGKGMSGFRRQVVPNFNMIGLSSKVPHWTRRNAVVYSGKFDDGITYLMIATWSRDQADALKAAYDVLKETDPAKGLIVDVRPNSGGDETLAMEFAGCFIDKPVVYGKNIHRVNGQDSQPFDCVLDPSKSHPPYRGKVVVLSGPAIMSSCDSFLLMMKQVPGCKLVGQRSYGSSGNPKPFNLENDVTVYLPSWKALRPDGTCFEGEGIAPDVEVKADPREFLRGDPVVDAALKALRGR